MIYDHAGKQRKSSFPAGPDLYRSLCYERDDKNRSFRSWMLGIQEPANAVN